MRRTLRYWPQFALVVVCVSVYWVGLSGGYFFDDFPNLVTDHDWRMTSLTLADMARAMGNGISSDGGRPLALLSFGLNHYFTGMDPLPMKLTNLIIHIGSALLVFQLCLQFFDLLPRQYEAIAKPSRFAAFAISLAWAVHPLQVSSVLYIVQRMELGSQFFVLLALLTYVQGRRNQIASKTGWPWFAGSLLSLALGMGFKESAILVPGFTFLIELTLLRFRTAAGARSRVWLSLYALGIFTACALFLAVVLPRYLPESAYAARAFTLEERLWTQIPVLGMYLSQFLLPLPERMPFYYDNFPISFGLFSSANAAISAGVLFGLLLLGLACVRRLPLVTLGIGWFFVAHALTSNVIPLELAFEHRNYLALLGLLLALSQPLRWLGAKLEADSRIVMTLLPVMLLGGLCHLQSRTWSEPLLLASSLASRAIDSPRASYDLGTRLMLDAGKDVDAPQWSLAKKEFEHAAKLPSLSVLPDQALIIMAARSGATVEPEVWERLGRKLAAKEAGPDEINALYALVNFSIVDPRKIDQQRLLDLFQVVLERNPESAVIITQYGNFAWNILKDRELAIRMQREAVRLSSNDLQATVGLAKYLLASDAPQLNKEGLLLREKIREANRDGRFDKDIGAMDELVKSRSQPASPAE